MTAWDPVRSIAAGVRAGRLDPVELTERALARAREVASLNAVVHLDEAGALRAARAVAGERAGSLAGVPLLVKEIIEVEGLPFRCGSSVFGDRVGGRDAEVVRRARREGAVIIGLTHSHEFAYGCTGTSNVAGPCRNPHDQTRMTGGSSSGSAAAVAAGVAPVALGTDTACSVRLPAALCGVVGGLPARGTLPAGGVFPLSRSLDRVGVLAASVGDAADLVGALAGIELPGPGSPPRLGTIADSSIMDCSAEVGAAYRWCLHTLAGAGASVTEVEPPDWAGLADVAIALQGAEAAAVHRALAAGGYQPDVAERLRAAAEVPGWRYVLAGERVAALTAGFGRLLATVDAVVLPTSPVVAPPLDAVDAEVGSGQYPVRDLLLRNNRPLNVTGFPALSVPIPSSGLPVGLQLIAVDDATAFAVAAWVEDTLRAGIR